MTDPGEITAERPVGPLQIQLKRKRLTIACLSCRSRKRRCNGMKPSCLQCLETQVSCEWPAEDRRKSRVSHFRLRPPELHLENDLYQSSNLSSNRAEGSGTSHTSSPRFASEDRLSFNMDNYEEAPLSRPVAIADQSPLKDSPAPKHHLALAASAQPPQPEPDWRNVHFAYPVSEPAPGNCSPNRAPHNRPLASSYQQPVRLSYEYLRPYGPTAIRPGLGRLRLSLRGNNARHTQADMGSAGPNVTVVDLHSRLPRADLREPLLDVYFARFSSTFPFLERSTFLAKLESDPNAESILLANTMCALSARFSTEGDILSLSSSPFCRGIPFADNAKQLLIPLLSLPSAYTTAALLLLAWYEFGMNSEGGLWNYSGMALRMAVDLGFHRQLSRIAPRSNRTLFWCIYILDRTLAIGTGRTTTLPDRQIDIADPDDDGGDRSADRPSAAFAYVVKFTRLYGRIAEIVNESPTWLSSLTTDASAAPTRAQSPAASIDRSINVVSDVIENSRQHDELVDLAKTEDAVLQLYESLPAHLLWNKDNLQQHVAYGDGEIYLHLHVWYNCIIAILYREPLLQTRAAFANISPAEALEIQKQASRAINDITHRIIDDYPALILNQPFINQCFYTSACTWLADIRSGASAGSLALARLRATNAATARANFVSAAKVLRLQSDVWAGVGWIAASLAKRGAGLSLQDIVNSGITDTILSAEEMRILTSSDANAENANTPSIMDLWSSILQSGITNEADSAHTIYEPLWGADGLFDANAEQLLFGDNSSNLNSMMGF